jgi:tRNA pseudouridine13 synthase
VSGYRLRDSPEDFRVDEIPVYAPSGEGGHTFVRVEKRLRTTADVAKTLARLAGVAPRDVGFAGRKDRIAVATQWFSVPELEPKAALDFEVEGLRVLEAVRHPHKLRTGQLRGNRFALVVRGVEPEAAEQAARRLVEATERGFPNSYGEQRFGRDGANAARGAEMLSSGQVRGDRREARFIVSALQAAVFNHVLAHRPLPLDELERGDVAVRHESGGLFEVEDVEAESPRAAAFEISATGPIFGTKMRRASGAPGERESESLRAFGLDLDALHPPRGIRLQGTRRPLRVQPQEARAQAKQDALELAFVLPAGSYATVLVEHLLGEAPAALGIAE